MTTPERQPSEGPYAYKSHEETGRGGIRNVQVTAGPSDTSRRKRPVIGTLQQPSVRNRRTPRAEESIPNRIERDVQDVRRRKLQRPTGEGEQFIDDSYEDEGDASMSVEIPQDFDVQTSLAMQVKVTSTSWGILAITLPFWIGIQFEIFLVSLAGLGMASLSGTNVSISDLAGSDSFVEFLGTLTTGIASWFLDITSKVTGFVFGVGIFDVGIAIYLACSMIIFVIGLCSIFYAYMMFSLRGINPMKGASAFWILIAVGIYLIPVLQCFPGVIIYVAAVWFAHRKKS